MSTREILRQVVLPLATLFAVVLAMLWASFRERGAERPWPPGGRAAVTMVVGYGAFLAIVAIFESLASGDEEALPEAVRGGGALLGIALGGFALLSALHRRLDRRGGRR